jgi:hypothetical protein
LEGRWFYRERVSASIEEAAEGATTALVAEGTAPENPCVARPLRKLWKVRTVVRRRHRTWMLSMCLASLAWGSWWITVFLMRYAPGAAPRLTTTEWFAGTFAAFGLLVALFTIRARRTWLLFTLVPLLANASLFLVPWLIETLRATRSA